MLHSYGTHNLYEQYIDVDIFTINGVIRKHPNDFCVLFEKCSVTI